MGEKKRLNLSFSLSSPMQQAVWKRLSAIPAGQRSDTVCRIIYGYLEQQTLLDSIRTVIREELQNGSFSLQKEIVQPEKAGDVDDDVLGFLLSLQEGSDEP